jgi:hypothetical protein
MEDISSTLVFESPETIKSIEIKDGKAIVGAYAIRFSGPDQKDLQGEFFTDKTYLGAHKGDGVDVLFNHGQAPTKAFAEVCNMVMSAAKSSIDAVGVFVRHVLDLSNEYEKAIADLCAAGKLKWSSGATSHMVKRVDTGEIVRWPIAEFSYTPTPAEPRLPAILPLKSVAMSEAETKEIGAAFKKSETPPVDKRTEADPPKLTKEAMEDPEIQKKIDAEVKAQVDNFVKDHEKIQAAVKARTKEIEEIYAIGDKFGKRGEATQFVEEGKTLGEFQTFILERLNVKGMQALSLNPDPDSCKMKRKEFDAMSVGKRNQFLKSGGQLID